MSMHRHTGQHRHIGKRHGNTCATVWRSILCLQLYNGHHAMIATIQPRVFSNCLLVTVSEEYQNEFEDANSKPIRTPYDDWLLEQGCVARNSVVFVRLLAIDSTLPSALLAFTELQDAM